MEILIPKISPSHDDARYYDGVIAYGSGADGKAYVLRTYPEAEAVLGNITFMPKDINDDSADYFEIDTHGNFVICEANQDELKAVFNADDEMGAGIIFDWYDEAIEGFTYFLDTFCLIYYC